MARRKLAAERIRTCIELPVAQAKLAEVSRLAVEENPDNAPANDFEMAVAVGKRWRPGRLLRVRFLDGEEVVRSRVRNFARQWEDHANIELDFVDAGDAEIRVSFGKPGSWSYVGTVAKSVHDQDEPTMNLGWLRPDGAQEEYSRVVLHEFGHALGCVHEHQHPRAGIPWDLDEVYRHYEEVVGWSREQVERHVLDRYSENATQFSRYDSKSIMQYPVPRELTVGEFEIAWNGELSEMDKSFIGEVYPGRGAGDRE